MKYGEWDIGKELVSYSSVRLDIVISPSYTVYLFSVFCSLLPLLTTHRPDCTILPKLWGPRTPHHPKQLFVDIGANLGSCSLVMSAHGAHVLSFEPQVE